MDIIRGKCIDINHEGKGVIIQDRSIFFVDNLFKGEEAEVEVLYYKEGVYYGKVKRLIKKSNDRIEPKCKACFYCGGCQYQQIQYQTQLEYKTSRVKKAFDDYHLLDNIQVNDCIGADHIYYYRNKIQMPFGKDRNGKVIYGYYKEGTHDILPIEECFIEDKKVNPILKTIQRLIQELNILPYNDKTNTGILRYVVIRSSYHDSDLMVTLVTTKSEFKGKNKLVTSLLKAHPEITTIVNNINNGGRTSVVLGNQEEILFGSGYIKDSILGLSFHISSSSFFQVNPVQVERLYQTALNLIPSDQSNVILDAYSGVGTIGLIASKISKEVISVEMNQDAYYNAIENAKRNGIKNISFYHDDAGRFIESYNGNIDIVIMDPPRTGSDKRFLSIIKNRKIKKIIYISCDPETLARDVDYLSDTYQITYIQPVDMFPQTAHVETVVRLFLKNKDI